MTGARPDAGSPGKAPPGDEAPGGSGTEAGAAQAPAAYPLHFRLRPGGATVFRVAEAARDRRLEMVQIAVVNLRNETVRQSDTTPPGEAEQAEIADWIAARRARDRLSALAEIDALCDRLGLAAHWLKTDATDEEVAEVEQRLLVAMHDLRGVLVRRMS